MTLSLYYNTSYTSNADRWVLVVDGIRELAANIKITAPCTTGTINENGLVRHCIVINGQKIERDNGVVRIY